MSESEAPSLLDELWDFCQLGESELTTEDNLREIFERYGARPGNNTNISDYGFFLEACDNEYFTEEGVIQLLIEYFPDAANIITDDGWSPLLGACYNKNVKVGIVQLLIDAAPDSVRRATNDGCTPLHVACLNEYNVTLDVIQLLIDAAPDSVRSIANDGRMPIHLLCANDMDESTAIEILKLLLEKCPESIHHTNTRDYLPIHIASQKRPPEFCRVLIEAYPGSERISSTTNGMLPLHYACEMNTLPTVEYLHNLYPDAVNHSIGDDRIYPIHLALFGVNRDGIVPDIVQFLLDCDPNVKLQKLGGESLLHRACLQDYDDSNIDAALQVINAIYDAHPKAIRSSRFVSSIFLFHEQVQTFINNELVYARQAKNRRQMTTRNGLLRLHRALENNVTLGSIKLLVKGNPSAIRNPDNNGALPLHLACEYHNSPRVIQYLIDLDSTSLLHEDGDNNTALHYACRGAKYDTIATLLEKYDAVSVSKENTQQKLPIELLWESSEVCDRESVEYLDSVFRLLKAYPEKLKNVRMQMQQPVSDACFSPSKIGKKRKFEH